MNATMDNLAVDRSKESQILIEMPDADVIDAAGCLARRAEWRRHGILSADCRRIGIWSNASTGNVCESDARRSIDAVVVSEEASAAAGRLRDRLAADAMLFPIYCYSSAALSA